MSLCSRLQPFDIYFITRRLYLFTTFKNYYECVPFLYFPVAFLASPVMGLGQKILVCCLSFIKNLHHCWTILEWHHDLYFLLWSQVKLHDDKYKLAPCSNIWGSQFYFVIMVLKLQYAFSLHE